VKNVYEIQQDIISRENRSLSRRWYYLGVGLIILGIILRQPLFVVIGLLITLVLAMVDIWSVYCLRYVAYKRSLSEKRVLYGEDVTLSLTLENTKILPLPWIEVQDAVPRALPIKNQPTSTGGSSSSFTLDTLFNLRWYDRVTRRYTVQCRARGVHTFGPTTLRSGDIFGFVDREAELENRQYVLVYPMVVPLTSFNLPARHPFGDRRAPRRLLEDPSRVVGVREYVYGDSLRRVDWKATARMMQMQSKIYEATTTHTIVLFLNAAARSDEYYGIHPELQELSICAAASVTEWAVDQGYAVGLYANSVMYMPDEEIHFTDTSSDDSQEDAQQEIARQRQRRRIRIPASSNEAQRQRIMETLARVQPFFGTSIEDVLQTERTHLPTGATVIIITTTISDSLVDVLARVRQGGHAVSVLFVGNSPLTIKVAGITVHSIGGEEIWRRFEAAYSSPSEDAIQGKELAPAFAL
jgi:uncharacterized protein (DUF58 family)